MISSFASEILVAVLGVDLFHHSFSTVRIKWFHFIGHVQNTIWKKGTRLYQVSKKNAMCLMAIGTSSIFMIGFISGCLHSKLHFDI